MSLFALPKEILLRIVQRFDVDDDKELFLQLQLTCKAWCQIAREIFFQRYVLEMNPHRANVLLQTLGSNKASTGQCIKFLQFGNQYQPFYEPETVKRKFDNVFYSIIIRCPNLRCIRLVNDNIDHVYLSRILDAVINEHVCKLQKVKTSFKTSLIDRGSIIIYEEIMYAARATIKCLSLYEKRATSKDSKREFPFLENIELFPALEKLKLHTQYDMSLLELPPLLHNKKNVVIQKIQLCTEPYDRLDDEEPFVCPDPLQQLPSVTKFDAEISTLTFETMQLLQCMFPRLDTLCLTVRFWDEYQAILMKNGKDLICQFFQHASKLKRFEFRSKFITPDMLVQTIHILKTAFHINSVLIVDLCFDPAIPEFWVYRQGNKIVNGKPLCYVEIRLLRGNKCHELLYRPLFDAITTDNTQLDLIQIGANSMGESLSDVGTYFHSIVKNGQQNIKHFIFDTTSFEILPDPESYFTRWRLDSLWLDNCDWRHLIQLSKYIRFATLLKVSYPDDVDEEDDLFSFEVDMPSTTFKEIHLETPTAECFFKIFSNKRDFFLKTDRDGNISPSTAAECDLVWERDDVRTIGFDCADAEIFSTTQDSYKLV